MARTATADEALAQYQATGQYWDPMDLEMRGMEGMTTPEAQLRYLKTRYRGAAGSGQATSAPAPAPSPAPTFTGYGQAPSSDAAPSAAAAIGGGGGGGGGGDTDGSLPASL